MSSGHSMVGNQEQRVVMLLERLGKWLLSVISPSPCGWGQPFGLGMGAVLSPWGRGLRCLPSLPSHQPAPRLPAGEKLGGASPGLTGRQPPAQAPRREWNTAGRRLPRLLSAFLCPLGKRGRGKRNN